MAIAEVSENTFADEVLMADGLVVVDYWADWCAPCKQIAPILEELSATYAGRMLFAKIDTNANMNTPAKFGIMGLPTLQVFINGEVVDSIVGAKPKGALIKAIEKHL